MKIKHLQFVWVIFFFLLDNYVVICTAQLYSSNGSVNIVVGK